MGYAIANLHYDRAINDEDTEGDGCLSRLTHTHTNFYMPTKPSLINVDEDENRLATGFRNLPMTFILHQLGTAWNNQKQRVRNISMICVTQLFNDVHTTSSKSEFRKFRDKF